MIKISWWAIKIILFFNRPRGADEKHVLRVRSCALNGRRLAATAKYPVHDNNNEIVDSIFFSFLYWSKNVYSKYKCGFKWSIIIVSENHVGFK